MIMSKMNIKINENVIHKALIDSIKHFLVESTSFKDLTFVAYGTDSYDSQKFKPFNKELTDSHFYLNKPIGGLWASPLNSRYGWGQWSSNNRFRLKSLEKHFLFKINPNAKIYVIDDIDDLINISTKINNFGQKGINFDKLINDNYDGIFVTSNAIGKLRYVKSPYEGLSSWDVESICIFNPNAIIPIEEDAFEKASVNKYENDITDEELEDNNLNDRKYLQMQSDFEKYGNQNVRDDMSSLFKGKQHPALSAQKHGNSKDAKLARKFNGTIKSGI